MTSSPLNIRQMVNQTNQWTIIEQNTNNDEVRKLITSEVHLEVEEIVRDVWKSDGGDRESCLPLHRYSDSTDETRQKRCHADRVVDRGGFSPFLLRYRGEKTDEIPWEPRDSSIVVGFIVGRTAKMIEDGGDGDIIDGKSQSSLLLAENTREPKEKKEERERKEKRKYRTSILCLTRGTKLTL